MTYVIGEPCIDIIDNHVQVIDLATGYTDGWIDFGDGTDQLPYVSGQLIEHDYTVIGDYIITLVLSNELGCTDTFSRQLCVENRLLFYVPNSFSPNGDGFNDILEFEVFGVGDFSWSVFSRWGEKVFESNSTDSSWDGTIDGKPLDPGIFVIHIRYTDLVTDQPGEQITSVALIR